MRSRIMYIESKAEDVSGNSSARIGRVSFSKSGRSIYYRRQTFQPLSGRGFKANYFEIESGDWYWISGCHKDGSDSLYPQLVEIDDDVREEYWRTIRGQDDCVGMASFRSQGKHSR